MEYYRYYTASEVTALGLVGDLTPWQRVTSVQVCLVVPLLILVAAAMGMRRATQTEGLARNQIDVEIARQAAEAALRDAERDLRLPDGNESVQRPAAAATNVPSTPRAHAVSPTLPTPVRAGNAAAHCRTTPPAITQQGPTLCPGGQWPRAGAGKARHRACLRLQPAPTSIPVATPTRLQPWLPVGRRWRWPPRRRKPVGYSGSETPFKSSAAAATPRMTTRISLVGMPGCGKSTVGRQLARQLGLRFFDSDSEIERRIGMPIREFFDVEGEGAFRDIEQDVIEQFSRQPGIVLATGGGAVLRRSNREALHAHTHVFYLRASPEDLNRRLRNDTHRPLLQVADPLRKLRDLYRERDPLYRRTAHFVVESVRPSVPALTGMVLMQLELAGLVDPQQVPSSVGAASAGRPSADLPPLTGRNAGKTPAT